MSHLRLDDWKAAMEEDKDQLYELLLRAKDVNPDRDAKLKELKKLISEKVKNPTTNKTGDKNKKVLIFTAFADTSKILV